MAVLLFNAVLQLVMTPVSFVLDALAGFTDAAADVLALANIEEDVAAVHIPAMTSDDARRLMSPETGTVPALASSIVSGYQEVADENGNFTNAAPLATDLLSAVSAHHGAHQYHGWQSHSPILA